MAPGRARPRGAILAARARISSVRCGGRRASRHGSARDAGRVEASLTFPRWRTPRLALQSMTRRHTTERAAGCRLGAQASLLHSWLRPLGWLAASPPTEAPIGSSTTHTLL